MSISTLAYHIVSKVPEIHLTLGNQPINHIEINGCHSDNIPRIVSRTFLGYNSKIAQKQQLNLSAWQLIDSLDHKILNLEGILVIISSSLLIVF